MSEYTLLVECNTDALAAAELGESAIAAGGPGDFSDEQMDNLRGSPGLLYILPDDDTLGGEAPRRWVFDLYPKALLCPAEYGEGLEDVSQLLHKRGKATARKVLEGLKARAVDALELEAREVEEHSADGSQSLATYRRTKERILPLVARLEDEGERDAALRDVARRTGLGLRSLRKALDDAEEAPESEGVVTEAVPEEPSVAPEEVEELIGRPGVLERYVEDSARIHGVVRETQYLKLLTLNARGAQLEPLANGRPVGANLVLIAEAGRGKNYVCDAVAAGLPEDFYVPFESASAKSLYYRAESDPTILKHRWAYPNEAEATDELVEMF
jgi:DNA primase